MKSKECPFCMEEMKEDAIKCNHCNARLVLLPSGIEVKALFPMKKRRFLWLPVLSLVFGILCVLALFGPLEWVYDMIDARLFLSAVALILGVISIVSKTAGRGMAIAGIVLGSISLLVFLVMLR
jgi:hypothetical protein